MVEIAVDERTRKHTDVTTQGRNRDALNPYRYQCNTEHKQQLNRGHDSGAEGMWIFLFT